MTTEKEQITHLDFIYCLVYISTNILPYVTVKKKNKKDTNENLNVMFAY